MHCPLESLETVVERCVCWVISKCFCLVHGLPLYYIFSLFFFRLGCQCFLFDMVIADLCMYVGNSVVHLHICGVGLGWVWLLWCVNWFCQIMGLASRKNNKRRQRKVPSLQQPWFTDSKLILCPTRCSNSVHT
jgi:hypothetical protein